MRILLADDHQIVREGLKRCLAEESSWQVVGEAANGQEAVDLTETLRPDVVVMDIGMPRMNGIEATLRICRNTPAKVIVLSAHSDRQFVAEMLRAGASGYLLKNSAFKELTEAIRSVAAGRKFLSPAIASILAEQVSATKSDQEISVFERLTNREREILQLLAEGHDVKGVGAKLKISPKTVYTLRTKIMRKLKIDNVADLTKYAIRRGMTQLEKF